MGPQRRLREVPAVARGEPRALARGVRALERERSGRFEQAVALLLPSTSAAIPRHPAYA